MRVGKRKFFHPVNPHFDEHFHGPNLGFCRMANLVNDQWFRDLINHGEVWV